MAATTRRPKPLVYNAVITRRENLTDTLAIFRVQPDAKPGEAEPARIPEWIGGQYATLGLNNERNPAKGPSRRPYSIASPPEEREWLDFYVRYVAAPTSDNPLTHLLWEKGAGDRIYLGDRILGKFTLADTVGVDDTRLKIFVSAGTGLAPFVSIVKSVMALSGPESLKQFVILHGASHAVELGYRDDLEMVMNDVQRRYFPTISRTYRSPGWNGPIGRVESFFDDQKLEDLEQMIGVEPGFLWPENAVVYVCGLQGTIANTLINLLKRGFVPENRRIRRALQIPEELPATLFFEQYDSDPVIDLKNEEFLETLRKTFPRGLEG